MAEQAASLLQALEQDHTLLQETSFSGRIAALDLIETHVFERAELELGLGSPADTLVELACRARAVAERLEEANARLFRELESRIASGGCRGSALRRELIRHAGSASRWDASGRNAIYDHLDVLVAGLLRVGTPPEESVEREPEMVPYQPTPARVILELIDRADIRPDDIFYDLGSGLGQVPILVNLLTGARASGIEAEPGYCFFARRCAERLNTPQVQFLNIDAREANYAGGTVFYLYTPFTGKMLDQVLSRVAAQTGLRRIRLVSYGPCAAAVSRQGWLRCLDRVCGEPEFELAVFESHSLPPLGPGRQEATASG